MKSVDFLDAFKKQGVLTEGHFKLRSMRHSEWYVEKALIYANSRLLSRVCWALARIIVNQKWLPDVIAAPETGGIALETGVARELSMWLDKEIAGVYAEKNEKIILSFPSSLLELSHDKEMCDVDNSYTLTQILGVLYRWCDGGKTIPEDMLRAIGVFSHLGGFTRGGDELFVRRPGFVFKRGYGKIISGKRVAVCDDILTTGGSLARLVDAVYDCGGIVAGAVVIWNRGGVTAESIGVPCLVSLLDETIPSWAEEECRINGPCAKGIPIEVK